MSSSRILDVSFMTVLIVACIFGFLSVVIPKWVGLKTDFGKAYLGSWDICEPILKEDGTVESHHLTCQTYEYNWSNRKKSCQILCDGDDYCTCDFSELKEIGMPPVEAVRMRAMGMFIIILGGLSIATSLVTRRRSPGNGHKICKILTILLIIGVMALTAGSAAYAKTQFKGCDLAKYLNEDGGPGKLSASYHLSIIASVCFGVALALYVIKMSISDDSPDSYRPLPQGSHTSVYMNQPLVAPMAGTQYVVQSAPQVQSYGHTQTAYPVATSNGAPQMLNYSATPNNPFK